MAEQKTLQQYWRKNMSYMVILLVIWFVVSYVCGILLVQPLNEIRMAGFPLGFWFAQQGSIYVFVILIFVYSAMMHRIERKYDVDDDEG